MASRRRVLPLAIVVVTGAALCAHVPTGERFLPGSIADRVVVDKAVRTLTLVREDRVLKTYRIRLGRNPSGAKTREGDGRTPEGDYRIDHRNPRSRFHLALHVSYPSPADARRAAAAGVPLGGDIMIHGLPNGLGWLGRLHQGDLSRGPGWDPHRDPGLRPARACGGRQADYGRGVRLRA